MFFNIEQFKAKMSYGLAKPNKYDVIIGSPNRGISPEIGLVAEEAELPGKFLASRQMGLYGPSTNFPYQEIYTNLRISFICSADFWERRWFEEWQRSIVNPKSGYFGYYRDYVSDIRIQQLTEANRLVYEGVALEAWPIAIDSQQLSYKAVNSYHTLTVSFAYVRFVESFVLATTSGDSGVSGFETPKRNEIIPSSPNGLPSPGNPIAQ